MSSQNLSGIADSYGIYTYKDDLIWFVIEDHDNWRHREIALKQDFFIKAYVKRLNEEIWSEKPITTPDIFGGKAAQEEEQLKLMNGDKIIENEKQTIPGTTNVTEEWELENWSSLCIKFFDKSRIHSFSVVRLYNEAPFWRVFCDREIKKIYYDDKDQAIKVDVEWSRALPYSDAFMNYEESITLFNPSMDLTELDGNLNYGLLVPFGHAESEDRLGEFDLEDKWTLAVRIRYALLDVAVNSSKTSGFYQYIWGRLISPAQELSLKNACDMASSSQGIGAKRDVLEEIVPIFPAKPEFTIEALGEFKMNFAMACRLPLKYFRSEGEKGSLFGDQSGEDIQVNKKMRYIFSKFKTHIITLIFMRWGIKLEDIEPFILESEEEEIEVPMDKEEEKPNKKEKEVIK